MNEVMKNPTSTNIAQPLSIGGPDMMRDSVGLLRRLNKLGWPLMHTADYQLQVTGRFDHHSVGSILSEMLLIKNF